MNYENKTKINNKLENLYCGLTFIVIILYQKKFYQKLWKIFEWSTYCLCNLAEKLIWGRQINCQGRYLYDVDKKFCSYSFMVCISYIYIVYITLYVIVLYQVSYKFIWNDGVCADNTPHYCAQAVESFELNYDTIHMCY